jgi:hypothetical protein
MNAPPRAFGLVLVHAVFGCTGRGATSTPTATPTPAHTDAMPAPAEMVGPDEPPRERGPTCPGSDKGWCAKSEYCVWHDGTSECTTAPKPVEDHESKRAVWACTRPLDCGPGNQCCTSPTQTWRGTNCAKSCDLKQSTLVCDTVTDCEPRLDEVPPYERSRAKIDCGRTLEDEGPMWLKLCSLEVP